MQVTAEEPKTSNEALRAFEGNRIRYVIEGLVDLKRDESLRDSLRERICRALGVTKRYTQMLNNTVQPSLEDATIIAQILGVTVDELCILATEAKAK
jgi:hypothetical protein